MYPEAEILVVQVSLSTSTLDQLVTMGEALAPLRGSGILIIGSGGSVHNLHLLNRSGKTEQWVEDFEGWLRASIESNPFENLVNRKSWPQSFRYMHSIIEHYAPLIAAWAAGQESASGLQPENLGISHYLFGVEQ